MINQDLKLQLRKAGYKGKFGLSEFIEACMDKGLDGDFHLESLHGEWGASTCWKEKDDWERGNTPEEAVAKLYLDLNKK